jgi:hypothetical protein
MFDPEEIPQVKKAIRECALLDRKLLDDLRVEVIEMKPNVRVIKPRAITTFSLVASDSTNNKLTYDPFYFQLIRVVDSNGRNLCLDTITPTTDTDILSKRQFDELGNAKTALGCLMKDLGCETLNDLSPMIPTGEKMRKHPEQISKSWVLTYRDLCEWAVLYETICYEGFTNNTVVVRDGLLRSKIFKYYKDSKRALFIEMMTKINNAIDEIFKRKKIKIFFVGLAKHSQVLTRYSLAMQLEDIFPKGEARYAKVPDAMEASSLIWKEYMRKVEGEEEDQEDAGEINKYNMGSLYLVRFGKHSGNPMWAIDLLDSQSSSDAEIFGYLLMDTIDGFPIPHYPSCLQKALEHAQIVDFDLDILQDEVVKAIREILPSEKQEIMDHQILSKDQTSNRQS